MNLLIRWLLNALALFIVSRIVPGIVVSDFAAALIAVIVMAFVNTLIKPLLILLTLPVTIVTLGLFTFVINALMLMLVAHFTPGFDVNGFGAALIGSILLTLVSTLLFSFVK